MKWLYFIPFILITTVALGKTIPSPPPLKDEPPAEQHYFQTLYDNWNKLEETTTNPNGNRLGKKGDIVLYKAPYILYYFSINIDGAYHWWAVEITDIL